MTGFLRRIFLAALAGAGAASLVACAPAYPDRTYEAPPDRANYDAPAGYTPPVSRTTESTTTYYGPDAPTGTVYREETVTTYTEDGKPARYIEDDPHHYGRGPNQHKY